jgi:multiple sugar transport system substrate-binding protein
MLDPDYTWEELNAWIGEITEAGATNDDGQPIYGGNDHGVATQLFYQWLVQKGIEPWDGETPGFTQQDIVDYLSLEDEGLDNGWFYPVDRTTQVAPLDGFSMNESASSLTYASFYGRYAPEVGAENIVMLPVPSGENGEKAMWFGPSNYAIGANTEHPREATELADFLARDARVAEIFGTDRGIMVDSDTRAGFEPQEGTGDAEVLAYVDSVQQYATAITPQTPENFASYEAEWLRLNEERMYGNITAEEFAEQWWTEAGL